MARAKRTRQMWELRINGIRLIGDTFTTWHAAQEAMWKKLDQMHYTAQRNVRPEARTLGEAKNRLLSEYLYAAAQTPRPNLSAGQAGVWSLQVNRIPW